MITNDILIDELNRIEEVIKDNLKELSQNELEERITKDANSIDWLVWHIGRVIDSQIIGLIAYEQVWVKEQWNKKFNLPFNDSVTGYGHTSEEVGKVQASLKLLLGYLEATINTARTIINKLDEKDYQKVIDTNYKPPVTLAVRLASVITDIAQHTGQVAYLRGIIKNK